MFTSTLTVGEFVLGDLVGAQPLAQVMGSSFHQVGYTYRTGWSPYAEELRPVSDAFNDARRHALERLDREARRAGANAVVAVRTKLARHEWASNAVEFTVIGTAVRMPGADPDGAPVLTNLSGQDHYLLVRAGWRPLGLVAATCVSYVPSSWQTQSLTTGWQRFRSNTELHDFTQGVYQAREVALGRVTGQAERVGAAGVVGVNVEQHHALREVDQGGGKRQDLIVTFHVTGTAIAEGGRGLAARPVVSRNA